MFAGDLHKRSKDITTIEGYVKCNTAVQLALMQEIRDKNIDYFVSLGDWYDKGYAEDVSASLADYDLDIQMNALLNGNFYGVIGNHIKLSLDSNPELHLIQPHPTLRSRRATLRSEQIIRTPKIIRVNDVQISLMHYEHDTDDALEFKPVREEWAKYHIAVFHTHTVIPNSALVNTAYGYNTTSNTKIGQVMQGVDMAIVGHIHDAIGQITINHENGSTVMIVPGSLTNVDAGEHSRHNSIAIPIVTVGDDSSVKLEYLPFNLRTNMVTFKKKNIEESREKLKSLRGKPQEDLHDTVMAVAAMTCSDDVLTSLNAFMRSKGYTKMDKDLIMAVIEHPDELSRLVEIYTNGKEGVGREKL